MGGAQHGIPAGVAATLEDTAARIASLETGHQNLTGNVNALANTIRQLGEDVREEIKQLSRELASARRPDWMVVFSGVSLAVLLFGAGLTPLYLMISYAASHAEQNAREGRDHEVQLDALAVAVARLEERVRFHHATGAAGDR